jgi:Cdc6-like AAA superfamily ATPase
MPKAKNDHVWDYLTYYLGLPHSPDFAVLVSGPWGVGKTFLVKRFLAKHFEDQKDQYVYVSLYGLSTLEEIDDALLQAIFPRMTGTAAKVIGRVAKSALKIVKVDASEFDIRDFLNKFDAKVYVFDDLERFEGTINKVLGYINQFVEHGGAKVTLIANEQEISVDNDYSRRRESAKRCTCSRHSPKVRLLHFEN